MVFCAHCGAQMEEGTHYCPSCGKAIAQARAGRPDDARVAFENLSNTPDTTGDYTPAEIENGKGMACLSYLGILFLIPFIACATMPARDSCCFSWRLHTGLLCRS